MRCVLYVEHIKLHIIIEKYMVKQTLHIYILCRRLYIYNNGEYYIYWRYTFEICIIYNVTTLHGETNPSLIYI